MEITDERIAELEFLIKAGEGIYLSPRIPLGDPGRNIADEIEAIIQRLRRAEAIVSKLPVTADGVPVTSDMILYCPRGHEDNWHKNGGRIYCTQGSCWDAGCQSVSASGTHYRFEQCYSTREAALAAKPSPHPQTPPETSPSSP